MGLIDLIKHRLNPRTIAKEMDAGVVRLVGQGAAEAAQALFTGNGFVPYGPTDRPLTVETPVQGTQTTATVQAPAVMPVNPQPTQASGASMYFCQPQQSFQQKASQAAARMPSRDKDQGIER
jgi:hypothetical protein